MNMQIIIPAQFLGLDLLMWVLIVIIAIVAILVIVMFNTLVVLRARINNAWKQIDVQTKRRYDLIPNLVETVKGYAKHERKVFNEITKARSAITKSRNIHKQAKAQGMLTEALKTLFAVAENYPKLRASENFMQLQEELSGIEAKIAYARQFYNDSVMTFNARIKSFPTNLLAGPLGFQGKEYYEAEPVSKKPVKVKF